MLIEYEGEDFATTGDIRDEELLRITSVHPLREEAVDTLLKAAKAGHEVIDELLKPKLSVSKNENSYLLFFIR